MRAAEARGLPGERVGPDRRHSPGSGGLRSTGREGGTREASSSSGRRRLAVHREGARVWDRGGIVILRAVEARGPLGGRGGSRSTGREGGTGEVSLSSWRRGLAVHREGGWHRGGVILRAAESRSPPGGRVGPRRCRNPPGGGGSWSTGREDGSWEALSSGRRRLVVHRERGWDREGVILRAAGARGPPGGRVGPGRRRHPPDGGGSRSTRREGGTGEASSSSGRWRLAVHREGGRHRGGVVILRAAEARGPPGGRVAPGRRRHAPGGGCSRSWRRRLALRAAEACGPPGGRVGSGRRRHPPSGGGSLSTEREGGTGEASSSSGWRRLAVHREGGLDWGGIVILPAAEARGPLGRRGGSRSTEREGGTGEASSSSGRRRLAVHREGGWDRGGVVILQAAEARCPPGGRVGPRRRRHPPGGGGSRSTGREGGTGEASSSSGRWRLTVHWEGGEARGPPRGRVGPGRRRHPPGGGGSRSTGREGGTREVSSSGWRRLAVHREGGWDLGGVVILRAAEARGPPGGRVGPGSCRHPPGGGGSRSTEREGGTGEVLSSSLLRRLAVHREGVFGPGRYHCPGSRGCRSTGREGGTGHIPVLHSLESFVPTTHTPPPELSPQVTHCHYMSPLPLASLLATATTASHW